MHDSNKSSKNEGSNSYLLNDKFGRNHVFLIAINEYDELPSLANAINDARTLAKLLKQPPHNFTIHPPLLNPTYEDIMNFLKKVLPKKVRQGDRVLFYYAGHGVAFEEDNKPIGYLLPKDAKKENSEKSIAMSSLHEALIKLSCRHFLLILDCCFAGAFRWARQKTRGLILIPKQIYQQRFDRYIEEPAWQVITSASYRQEALDIIYQKTIGNRGVMDSNHSPFASHLFAALHGEADLIPKNNPNGLITATELYLYLREKLEPASIKLNQKQTPGFFTLDKHESGEFLFLSPKCMLNFPAYNEDHNPYKGLKAYEVEDQDFFYGRDKAILELESKINKDVFTVVVGASGTGKSSLIKAGIIPKLNQQEFEIIPIRPGIHPMKALEHEINTLQPIIGHKKWGIFVDQFEELITQCSQKEEAQQFMDRLHSFLKSENPNFKLIITIRSDFEPLFSDGPLKDYWNKNRFIVPPISLNEWREIIIQPAIQSVLYFEPPELVDQIIEEVSQSPGALPLLSFTLSELFKRCRENQKANGSRAITKIEYDKLGGVIGSLTSSMENIYQNLNEFDKETLRKIMLRMISVEGDELAGQKVFKSDFKYTQSSENDSFELVINKLIKARLIVINTNENNLTFYEPAHDALIRSWSRLWEWITDFGKENLILQSQLKNAVIYFYDKKEEKKFLWHKDPRLELLFSIFNSKKTWFNQNEIKFITRSKKIKNWDQNKLYFISVSIIVLLFSLSVWALNQTKISNNKAEASRLTALALQKHKDDPTRALRLAELASNKSKEDGGVIKVLNDIISNRKFPFYKEFPLKKLSTFMDFSNDGNHFIWTEPGDSVVVLQETSGNLIRKINMNLDGINILALSEHSNYLAAGDINGKLELVDLRNNASYTSTMHKEKITCLKFSNDESYLATGGSDFKIFVWDMTLDTISMLKKHFSQINDLAFSDDNRYIVSGGGDYEVILWDFKKNKIINSFKNNSYVLAVDIDIIGKNILLGDLSDKAKIWNYETNEVITLHGHLDDVDLVKYSKNGQLLFTGGRDKSIKIWTNKGEELKHLKGHQGRILSAHFSPNEREMVTVSTDTTIKKWDIYSIEYGNFINQKNSVIDLDISYDGKFIITGGNKLAMVRDFRNWDTTFTETHKHPVNAVSFSPDANYFISAGSYPKLRKLDNFEQVFHNTADKKHNGYINTIAFYNQRKLVATGASDNFAIVWDFQSDTLRYLMEFKEHQHHITALVFHPTKEIIVSGDRKGNILKWNIKHQPAISLGSHTEAILSIDFSPTGDTILTASSDGKVKFWNLEGDLINTLDVNSGKVHCVVYAPDGNSFLTGSERGVTQLWNVQGLEIQRFELEETEDDIKDVAFLPDGKRIITASSNGNITIWWLYDAYLQSDKIKEFPDLGSRK